MDGIGAYLKEQRESKGIRLEEIASITKIHISSLKNLEDEAWNKLPPDPFLKGFISAYAQYVGLNTEELIKKFKNSESAASPLIPTNVENRKTSTVTADEETADSTIQKVKSISSAKMIGYSAVAICAVLIVTITVIGKNRVLSPVEQFASEESVDEPLDANVAALSDPYGDVEAETETLSEETPSSKAESNREVAETEKTSPVSQMASTSIVKTPTQPIAEKTESFNHSLSLKAEKRSWVKVVIDDNAPKEYFLGEGKYRVHKAVDKIKVVLGNADTATVLHNGNEVEGREIRAGVRIFTYPTGAKFPQDVPKRQTTQNQTTEEATTTPPQAKAEGVESTDASTDSKDSNKRKYVPY